MWVATVLIWFSLSTGLAPIVVTELPQSQTQAECIQVVDRAIINLGGNTERVSLTGSSEYVPTI